MLTLTAHYVNTAYPISAHLDTHNLMGGFTISLEPSQLTSLVGQFRFARAYYATSACAHAATVSPRPPARTPDLNQRQRPSTPKCHLGTQLSQVEFT